MPETSLKEYFARLNGSLSANASDEVIHHSRHILQYFPKNVAAYRLLGRALVMSGRWEEGRETLRRVLSVIPDDFIAHLGLSEANEHLDRPDEAIWHLERAFEQRPNDKDLIEELRNLYRQHRSVDNLKIQLTSAAVARQYLRSGAYTQAIDTLRSALARMNERLDLKLLLAQILWQQGSHEAAAEIALEVLSVLPDCLEANKIMAQLWLSENRPSDAQRYVNHLEAVDPYLAVELAQGYTPEDDVFRIDELDYVSTSQSELASGRPDWLQEISASPVLAVDEPPEAAPADWSDWASAMLNNRKPGEEKKQPTNQPTSSRFAAMAKQEEPEATGFTDFFGRPEDADADELSALFANSLPDEEDPLAWMHEAGVQIVDEGDEEPDFESLLAVDEDGPLPEMDDNPMAWMKDTGAEADILADSDETVPQTSDEDDPFAWMNTVEELADDAGAQPVAQEASSLDWLNDSDSLSASLDNSSVLDEALDLERLNVEEPTSDWEPSLASLLPDEPDDVLEDESPEPEVAEPAVPGPRRGLTAILQSSDFDWVNQQDETKAPASELDDWLSQFNTPEPTRSVTDNPDWLLELEQPVSDGQEPLEPDASEPESQVAAAEEGYAWMSDERAQESEQPEGDGVDWLREYAAQSSTEDDESAASTPVPEADGDNALAAADVPDWMADLIPQDEQGEAETPADDQTPDWMSELSESEPVSGDAGLEAPSLDDFPWMTEEGEAPSLPVEEESEPVAANLPDWMAELQPEPDAEAAQPAPAAAASDEFDWLTDDALAGAEAEAVAGDVPDWLSELEPELEAETEAELAEPEAEPLSIGEFPWMSEESLVEAEAGAPLVVDSEFTWMNDEAQVEEGEEAEAVIEGIPDWLADLQPEETEAEPEIALEEAVVIDETLPWMGDGLDDEDEEAAVEAVPAWLADLESTPEADAEEPEPIAAEVPDWFSDFEQEPTAEAVSEKPQPEPVEIGDFPWMSEETSLEPEAEEEAAAVADDIPDWLSELEPESDAEAAAEQPLAPAWMSEETESELEWEAEEAAAVADDVPDWLSELESGAEPESEAGADAEQAVPDWAGDEPQPEFGGAAYGEELEPVAEVIGDQFEDSEDFGFDEEEFPMVAEEGDEFLEPTPAQNAPDWLNAMVPGLDVDYEPGEEELAEEDFEELAADSEQPEYAWVTEMVEEEMAATARPVFVFSRPPVWFGSFGSTPSGNGIDDDLPDWPSDDADADVPEWLR